MPPFLATYRVQMHRDFSFASAASIAPYLQRLGISHLYSSPIFCARTGSTHGYDVTDPTAVNPKLGGEEGRREMIAVLHRHGLGLLLDIVPNHMATGQQNPRWEDVLRHGPSSPYAQWFDIDWRSHDPQLRGRVLIPILGDLRHKVLARGEIKLEVRDGEIRICYFDHTFPLDPSTLPRLLNVSASAATEPLRHELEEIVAMLRRLPPRTGRKGAARENRVTQSKVAADRLSALLSSSADFRESLNASLAAFGDGEGGAGRLDKLLDRQVYRLAYWRRAAREINYRRFFDINDLVAVRVEDEQVFEATHRLVFEWTRDSPATDREVEGSVARRRDVDALRIDHIDGLTDPTGYLERLARRLKEQSAGEEPPLFVEKIIAAGERLRADWPVAGTTGYEFLNHVETLFIEPDGLSRIENHYRRRIGGAALQRAQGFAGVAVQSKRRVLKAEFSAYVGRLARQWAALDSHEHIPPQALATAAHVIAELIAELRVYRTYVDGRAQPPNGSGLVHPAEREHLHSAAERARGHVHAPAALDRLVSVLLLDGFEGLDGAGRERRLRFIARFQQLCSPAAAKGVEDTAFYLYVPLVSRNEVGGDPGESLTTAMDVFHRANRQRGEHRPQSLLTVTTHDTKRSADVRARLDVLSEIPDEWIAATSRWSKWNRPHRRKVARQFAPDPNTEYLLYQTLVGAWPVAGNVETSKLRNVEGRDAGTEGRWDEGNVETSKRQKLDKEVIPSASELEMLRCAQHDGEAEADASRKGQRTAKERFRERIEEYMLKAVREAKVQTSWVAPDEEFERAVTDFVRAILPLEGETPFLNDLHSLVARVARPGFWNSLSRTLLQLTVPGTPDVYQGDESWNFSLVDPDNRRAVDFPALEKALAEIDAGWEQGGMMGPLPEGRGSDGQGLLPLGRSSEDQARRARKVREMIECAEDGRIKLHVVHRALLARRAFPDLFLRGSYEPLPLEGPEADHALAFARRTENHVAIVAVARLTFRVAGDPDKGPIGGRSWSFTSIEIPSSLAPLSFESVLTGETLTPEMTAGRSSFPLAQLFASVPVALLVARTPGGLAPP